MQNFYNAPDGFKNDIWWKDLAIISKRWTQEKTCNSTYANNVNWYTAVAFCLWLSEKLSQNVRLPTEAELLTASGLILSELSEWCMNEYEDPTCIDLKSGWHKAVRGEFSLNHIGISLDTRNAASPINAYAFVGFRVVTERKSFEICADGISG